MKKIYKALIAIIFVITVALITTVVDVVFPFLGVMSEATSVLITSLQAIGLIATLLIAIRQLHDSKEIARATFIMELNKAWVQNEDYKKIYNKLHKCIDCDKECKDTCENKNEEIEKISISNYLTFFETIYILKKNGVINFDVLDDLFAYRFFMAVHNEKFIQKSKLGSQPYNFINIFCLEYEWLEYRKSIGKGDNDKKDKVMGTGHLKNISILTSAVYEDILKKGGVK